MIIKFDHITYIAGRSDKDEILKGLGEPEFSEEKLPNLEIKKGLMRRALPDHDLYFYGKSYPTEYIFYDETGDESGIELVGETVYGSYSDIDGAVAFLEGIFGRKVSCEDGIITCSMKGVLDKRDYPLVLKKADDTEAFADDRGYGVAAIIVNSDIASPAGCICTDHETLTVNGKELDICFLKSESTDIIFELVKVMKQTP